MSTVLASEGLGGVLEQGLLDALDNVEERVQFTGHAADVHACACIDLVKGLDVGAAHLSGALVDASLEVAQMAERLIQKRAQFAQFSDRVHAVFDLLELPCRGSLS